MDSMYLSGGILLSLIWDSLRSKDEDGHDIRLSRKEFMDSFKRIFNPNIKKNAHGNYSSDISKYLTCNFNGSGQIGFFVYGEGDRFDQELHDSEKYKEILHRIQLFADQWIDPSKEKELIRRILFVLSNKIRCQIANHLWCHKTAHCLTPPNAITIQSGTNKTNNKLI